jgi:hypothetical protein
MKYPKLKVSDEKLKTITKGIQNCYFVNQIASDESEQPFVSDLFYDTLYPYEAVYEDDLEVADIEARLTQIEKKRTNAPIVELTFTNARDILQFAIMGVFEHAVGAHIFALENISNISLTNHFRRVSLFQSYETYTNRTIRLDYKFIYDDPLKHESYTVFDENTRKFEITNEAMSNLRETMEFLAKYLTVECESPIEGRVGFYGRTRGFNIKIYPLAQVFKKKVQRFQSELCALLAHTTIHELAHIFENCESDKFVALYGEIKKSGLPKNDVRVVELVDSFMTEKGIYFDHCSRLKLFILYVGLKLGYVREDIFNQVKEIIKLQDVDFTKQGGHFFASIPNEKLEGESDSTFIHRMSYSRWESAIQDEFINAMASEKRPVIVPQSFVRQTHDLHKTLEEIDLVLGRAPRPNYSDSKSRVKLTYDVLETTDGVLNHYLIDSDEPFMNIYDCLGASQSRTVSVSEFREGYPFLGITLKGNSICAIYVDGFSRQVHEISLEEYWWILSL